MGIRTTVTLDDDVIARLKEESKRRDVPLRKLLNEAIRSGLSNAPKTSAKPAQIPVTNMGRLPGLNYDNIGELLEHLEGPARR